MKVAIVGSRHFSEPDRVSDYVNALPQGASIITGSASGVDAAATKAARAKGIPVQVIPASFDELADAAKSAARNQRLIDACDVLVAFWDGSSKGTRHTVDRALDSGKEVRVFISGGGKPSHDRVAGTPADPLQLGAAGHTDSSATQVVECRRRGRPR